jgi:hypothetical protein
MPTEGGVMTFFVMRRLDPRIRYLASTMDCQVKFDNDGR